METAGATPAELPQFHRLADGRRAIARGDPSPRPLMAGARRVVVALGVRGRAGQALVFSLLPDRGRPSPHHWVGREGGGGRGSEVDVLAVHVGVYGCAL